MPAELRLRLLDVGARPAHVPRSGGVALERERPTRDLLRERDRIGHRCLLAAADVVELARPAALHRGHGRVDGVADEREAPRRRPVSEQTERPAVGQGLEQRREGHVRPLPRAVDREVAHADGLEPGGARMGVRQMLHAQLRHPVRRDRARAGVLTCRVALRVAVDGGRGRVNHPHAPPSRRLEDASARADVPLDVGLEARPEARADTGLAGEVEHAVDAVQQRFEVGGHEVGLEHVEVPGVLPLALRVVVVGERVDAQDVVPGGHEPLREMRADEARRAGDEVAHG